MYATTNVSSGQPQTPQMRAVWCRGCRRRLVNDARTLPMPADLFGRIGVTDATARWFCQRCPATLRCPKRRPPLFAMKSGYCSYKRSSTVCMYMYSPRFYHFGRPSGGPYSGCASNACSTASVQRGPLRWPWPWQWRSESRAPPTSTPPSPPRVVSLQVSRTRVAAMDGPTWATFSEIWVPSTAPPTPRVSCRLAVAASPPRASAGGADAARSRQRLGRRRVGRHSPRLAPSPSSRAALSPSPTRPPSYSPWTW